MPEQEGSREGNREWGVGSGGGPPNPTPYSPLPTAHSPDIPTPGETAYAAYQAALPERAYFPAPAWTVLDVAYQRAWEAAAQDEQAAWEAAAQAVLTMKQEEGHA